ncbi:integrative conjugative element protein, RAQPRD family [Pectobacterium actinidiae]|uniref:integrative conjugative element protein, RAQPRD family n=1 Tax=Pectobacterium actinidiae TaxID=1507808 RepID=UPI004040C1D3
MCRFIGLSVLLASVCIVQAHASEKDELALVMRQLDQVQAGLDRARVVANQNGQDERFYFDYSSAFRDISAVRKGIEQYLEPSRAQPSVPLSVSGQYRQEKGQ